MPVFKPSNDMSFSLDMSNDVSPNNAEMHETFTSARGKPIEATLSMNLDKGASNAMQEWMWQPHEITALLPKEGTIARLAQWVHTRIPFLRRIVKNAAYTSCSVSADRVIVTMSEED